MLSIGFVQIKSNVSLFIQSIGEVIILLLVYVDDIVIIGNSSSHISSSVHQINVTFSLKDLNKLNYFLEIEVSYSSVGIHFSYQKYTKGMIAKCSMLDSKPIDTPMLSGKVLRMALFWKMLQNTSRL